ncbi:hypothetical protein JKI95_11500 [Corynebacterium aquatimens]|uniref:hypothetical protein n=1 Tax=Corynebacterium sp. CNCTC7651 TaxID=2815361 RepID=UPI001F1D2724|nr:hypothetical protein [Corynebacterium sp. CNCTC7651]QYH19609.1 hypothetical protein JKI95_11500 [Corynebacterium aquatimens]UIZ91412.1 hypothetical protein JZY91_06480 [Corynebacterium sp. CNCTC7651]
MAILSTVLSTAAGGIISLIVSLHFYRKASRESQDSWEGWFEDFKNNQARWRVFEYQNARYLQNNAFGREWDLKLSRDTQKVALTNLSGYEARNVELADLRNRRLIRADVFSGVFTIPVIAPFETIELRLAKNICSEPGFIIQWVNMADYVPLQSCRLRTTRELYFNPFELLPEFQDLVAEQREDKAETRVPLSMPPTKLDESFIRTHPNCVRVPFPSDFVDVATYEASLNK